MVSCSKTVSTTGACYSQSCQHLPLDSVFKSQFQDVRGGAKKRNRKHKGGSINYVLGVGKEPIGGQAEVVRHTTQPLYVEGKMVPGKDMCGGKRKSYKKKKSNKKKSKKSNKKKSKNNNKNNTKNNNKNNTKNNNKNKKSKKRKSVKKRKTKTKTKTKTKSKNNNKVNENNRNKKFIENLQSNNLNGGGNNNVGVVDNSVYTGNMNNRTFGCKQPFWDPKCA